MSMTDPISDMLTRLRNAGLAGHESIVVPRSTLKLEIARILKEEGYVSGFSEVFEGGKEKIRIFLKYDQMRHGVIQGMERISRPGRRRYVGKDGIPYVRNGLGMAILTTPRGVLSDKAARQAGVGGEVICYVW